MHECSRSAINEATLHCISLRLSEVKFNTHNPLLFLFEKLSVFRTL
jgi:hypothetical protein